MHGVVIQGAKIAKEPFLVRGPFAEGMTRFVCRRLSDKRNSPNLFAFSAALR